ncbi:MAG: Glycosyl transferase family 2 [Parcubacteria group bacterium GW2011_GWA1_36_12]|nr:MAG: Glycosyl transferase family 2 [Parcubacteria group bacterium GW2011_GWA1_36_12]
MIKKPEISVIMSVYNGMPYLQEAVKSILNQTYKDFEFIIVDDASTDDSLKYLKGINDKRIKILSNEKNLGLAVSLNKALNAARGEYIARMDADDISKPERLHIQLNFMELNPQIDICGSFVSVIDENGKLVGSIKKPTTDDKIKKQIYWLTPLLHPTWFAKKEVFTKLKGYDEKWDYVEDFEFLIRAKDFKMANISKYLLFFRSQKERRSQKTIEKIYRNSLKLRQKIFREQKLGFSYLPILVRSYISTYLLPTWLKIYLNKLMKFA